MAIWCAYLQARAQHLAPLEAFPALCYEQGYVSASPALTCTARVLLKKHESGAQKPEMILHCDLFLAECEGIHSIAL